MNYLCPCRSQGCIANHRGSRIQDNDDRPATARLINDVQKSNDATIDYGLVFKAHEHVMHHHYIICKSSAASKLTYWKDDHPSSVSAWDPTD
jgi:hypothetical protein